MVHMEEEGLLKEAVGGVQCLQLGHSETVNVGFKEKGNFQPLRDTGPHLPEGAINLTELDIFNLFFTDEIVNNLVSGTNDYFVQSFHVEPSYS